MTRIFINYRRLDSEGYVGRLFDHLTRHFDAGDVFMDVDSIPPGADFVAALESAVAACDVFFKRLDLPEKRGKISNLHGRLVKTRMPYGEIHVLPLYHPAVVLDSASQKETLRKDFEKLKLFI